MSKLSDNKTRAIENMGKTGMSFDRAIKERLAWTHVDL